MKKRVLSLALALCLCLALMPAASAAEDLGELTRAEVEERFGITITPDHIDFGTVPEQSGEYTHEQTITITNGYDKPIQLLPALPFTSFDISPSSAANNVDTIMEDDYYLSILQPGESCRFSVILATRYSGSGPATASIGIGLDANEYYYRTRITVIDAFTIDYEVQGFEMPTDDEALSLSVDSLDFGTVNSEGPYENVTRTFTATNNSDFPFSLRFSTEEGPDWFFYEMERSDGKHISAALDPGTTVTVTVTMRHNKTLPKNVEAKLLVTARYSDYDGAVEDPVITKEIPMTVTVLTDGGYRIVTDYTRNGYGIITDVNGTANYDGWYDGVAPGSDFTVCFRPTAGNHVLGVLVDGESVGAVESYTFTNVQSNHQLDILFGQGPAPSSWAIDQVAEAVRLYLVPYNLQSNYTQTATRKEFCALAVELYEKVTGEEITERATFSDTTDIYVQMMAGIGVINGVGNGKFDPDGELTREQAATILVRLADAMGKPLPEGTASFADNASIASWAIDAVGRAKAGGIMDGTGNNTFSPQGAYTREQSILTVMRLYEMMQ